jgi:hypothetical protein
VTHTFSTKGASAYKSDYEIFTSSQIIARCLNIPGAIQNVMADSD